MPVPPGLQVHQHLTIEGPIDCHVSDCDVYEIQAQARGIVPPKPKGPYTPRREWPAKVVCSHCTGSGRCPAGDECAICGRSNVCRYCSGAGIR